jgi:hypothetical protein
MQRKLHLIDYIIIFMGLASFLVAAKTMIEVPTLIIPGYMLFLLFGGILLLVSFGIGVLIRLLTNSKVHLLTAASSIIAIACISFCISQFRPHYKIFVADNFTGEVKLFRSTLKKNVLSLSQYGVGYITDEVYRNGFKPLVYQNGRNITNECSNLGQGSLAFASLDGKSIGHFSYVGFTIKDNSNDTLWTNLINVIKLKIIDTSIIKR